MNAAFALRMRGDTPSQASYVALELHRPSHPSQPAVVALRAAANGMARSSTRVEDSLPRRRRRVRRLAGAQERLDGHRARERARAVPIAPRHVCLLPLPLVDKDMTRPYARALARARARTCWSAAARSTSARRWRALRHALGAIERPDDELLS